MTPTVPQVSIASLTFLLYIPFSPNKLTTFACSQLPRDRGDEPADPRGGQQAVHRLRGAHADEPAGVQDQGVPVSPQVQRLRLAQDGNQEGSPGDSPGKEGVIGCANSPL